MYKERPFLYVFVTAFPVHGLIARNVFQISVKTHFFIMKVVVFEWTVLD